MLPGQKLIQLLLKDHNATAGFLGSNFAIVTEVIETEG